MSVRLSGGNIQSEIGLSSLDASVVVRPQNATNFSMPGVSQAMGRLLSESY